MKKIIKEEAFRVLCKYAPYKVKGAYVNNTYNSHTLEVDGHNDFKFMAEHGFRCYLRPMSSMTLEERKKFSSYAFFGAKVSDWSKAFDYLDSILVDYNDYIKQKIALKAPQNLYN